MNYLPKLRLIGNGKVFTHWLQIGIIVLVLIAIFFRFVNLDRKVYWYDETFTSLRISGYTEAEAVQNLSSDRIIQIQDLYKYQFPSQDKNLLDTINGLASEEPQHSPAYYLLARFWLLLLGNSPAIVRSLSVIFSVLAFPAIYWLCFELFEYSQEVSFTSLTGWIAVALMAVSPFHLIYAQEAREYSLWTLTIILSSAALLRAIRIKTQFSWGIYAQSLAVAIYAFELSWLVAIAHGIYLLIMEGFRFTYKLKSYVVALLFALIAFAPWLLVSLLNSSQAQQTLSWADYDATWKALVLRWIPNFSRIFVDWNYNSFSSFRSKIVLLVLFLLFLVLVSYSFYFLVRHSEKRIWLFILMLTGVTSIPLVLPDLILGEQRSIVMRYFIPAILGIELAVAYCLSHKITQISIHFSKQASFWRLLTIAILSIGIFSCSLYSQSFVWWNKLANQGTPNFAQIIDRSSHPLLIMQGEMGDIFPFIYLIKPTTKTIVAPECYACHFDVVLKDRLSFPKINAGYTDVFLFKARPTSTWLNAWNQNHQYQKELVLSDRFGHYLWRLKSS